MLFINHLRAHIFHHSSAALKINKPELAKAIVSVKQSKLQHAAYLKKDLDNQTIAKKESKYDLLISKCNNQIKAKNLISKIESESLTKDNADKALDLLLTNLKTSKAFCTSNYIFRISPNKDVFDKTSLTDIIKNTEKLIEKNSDNNHLIASKIKQEILGVTIDADVSETLLTLWYQYETKGEIPGDEALPYSLKAFIKFLKESIIPNQKDNQMGPEALANILGMIVTKNLKTENPTKLLILSKKVAPMYEKLLIN
ncbi:MAG: hypothetical protein ACRCSS_18100 [Shewanella sp.]